jgi:hypothetical protein
MRRTSGSVVGATNHGQLNCDISFDAHLLDRSRQAILPRRVQRCIRRAIFIVPSLQVIDSST